MEEDFEARYATVMDGMLRSAVTETTRLYEAMVEELRAGICIMRRENDALRTRCTRGTRGTEAAAAGAAASAAVAAARAPPRSTGDRQDASVQCDLIPVGVLLMGQYYNPLEDDQQPGTHGDGSYLLMKKEGDEPTLIGGKVPPTEHIEGHSDSSCEGGAQSQLLAVITPPPPLEKMAQQSDITRQISVTSESSETEADVLILDQDVQHHNEMSVKEQYDIAFKPSKTIASLSEGAALTEENPSAATELQRRQPKNAQGVHSSPSVLPVQAKNAQIAVSEAATGNQLPAVTSNCASTQTCSSSKKTISSILAETKVPPSVIPVFQQKRSAVVRLTRLSLSALTQEVSPVMNITVCNIKEEFEPIPLTPAVVQETETEDVKPILSKIRFLSRAKKVRLVRDRRTPTKTSNESSSSSCPNKTSSEPIPEKYKSPIRGFRPKQPIDKTSSVSPRRSRSVSKIVASHTKLEFTQDGCENSRNEPTQVHAKRPRLSQDVVSPKRCRLPTTPKLPSSRTSRPLTKSLNVLASTPPNRPQIRTPTSGLSSHNTGVQSIPDRAPTIVSPLQPLAVIGRRLLRHQCGVCGRVFSSPAALETHVSQHTVNHPFTCLLCGKTFTNARSLHRHVQVHRNGKAYVCNECGKGFALRFALTRHFNMVHERVKPFACQICNKDFFSKVEMESHLRVHTGEKPFECNLCEKKFTRRMDLNVHLRWHNGEKRYWCSYCERGFLDANNLKRHTYTHTGEKPHQCPHCPNKFTQSANLKKHLKCIHKLKA